MNLLESIRKLFGKSGKKQPEPERPAEPQPAGKLKKACKGCGKTFSVDPSWDYIPNYCKECKKKFTEEKEAKQRAGAPRKIRRKCKACGNYFSFPNTLEHFPNYCSNCRKKHQAQMKAKYSRKPAREK